MKRDLNRLRHRRTLRFLIWVVAAAIVLLPGSGFASAQDERLTFLDEDPVEFNLDQPPGASQTVEVVNGDTKPLGSLRLQVIGLPADVVAVEPPERTGVKPGATARFTLTRKGEATSGTGRLVAVGSNGAVARRPVVLASQNVSRGDDLDDVVLRAWRLWPWRDQFEVDAVVVEGADAIPGNSPIAFVSTEGDVAQVTFSDGSFGVTDLDRVGEYTGKADLRPSEDGGDLTVKVLAKDIWIWPLTILLLGLGVVSLISQYTRRDRPGDLLRVRLARLLNAATREEAASLERLRVVLPRLNPVVPRIRGQGDELLLLDIETKAALEDWSNALDDNERNDFEPPNGPRWKRLQDYLETYRELLNQLEDIGRGLARIRIRPEGHWTLSEADILKPILALLKPPSGLANDDNLRGRQDEAAAQAPQLKVILDIQDMLLSVWQDYPSLRPEVEAQLEGLWGAVGDLETEKTQAKDLYVRARKPSTPPSLKPEREPSVPAGERPREVEETRAEMPPLRTAERRSRATLIAGLTAALVLLAVALTRPLNADATLGPEFEWREPSALAVNLVGLLLLVALAIPIVLVMQRLVRRRDRERLHGEDEVSLRHALRRRDTAYAVLTGLIVILSGMSLVYAADATFGTPGDYLTILLWGTAVSEGLALAKSLLPSFS